MNMAENQASDKNYQFCRKDPDAAAFRLSELERELARMTLLRDELQTLIDNDGYPSRSDYEKLERELAESKALQESETKWANEYHIKLDKLERENARLRDGIRDVIARPDFTTPQTMLHRLESLLPNASGEPRRGSQ